MQVVRFSAVEMFGVPLDRPEDTGEVPRLVGLMSAYGLKGAEVEMDLVDITPYYWESNAFRYFLSRNHLRGPAVIDFMPRSHDSETISVRTAGDITVVSPNFRVRTLRVPDDMPAFALTGASPRFDSLCIHELIAAV